MRRVSVWKINVLPQMRKTFDSTEQEELTQSIKAKGILNPPIVAMFTRAEFEEYLRIINKLWKRSLEVANFCSSKHLGERFWYILLAGERRIRSYKSQVHAKVCPRFLKVIVHKGIQPLDALDIQFTENTHRRVPPHEEAHAYAQYWNLVESKEGKTPTLSSFSQRVGRSANTIKAALQFVSLPEIIRDAVAGRWHHQISNARLFQSKKLRLPYGIAVGLAQRMGEGVGESVLIEQMVRAVVNGVKVEKFREETQHLIAQRNQNVLDLMSEVAEHETALLHRRRTVEGSTTRLLAAQEVYLAKVLSLFKAGLLGKPDSPFAKGGVRNHLANIAELYEAIFPLLYIRPPLKARKRLEAVRRVNEKVLEMGLLL